MDLRRNKLQQTSHKMSNRGPKPQFAELPLWLKPTQSDPEAADHQLLSHRSSVFTLSAVISYTTGKI